MANCGACGKALDDDARFCPQCGAPTIRMAQACPSCGRIPEAADRFCEACGTPLIEPSVTPSPGSVDSDADPNPSKESVTLDGGAAPGAGSFASRGLLAARRHPRIAAAVGLAILAVVIAVPVVLSSSHHSALPGIGSPPSTRGPDPATQIQGILDRVYNSSQSSAKNLIANIAGLSASTRCWAGFAVDFPGQVLLTIIQPSGLWVQVNVDPVTGPDLQSLKNGPDYTSAGIDPTHFDSSGYQCQVRTDGSVILAAVGD